MSEESTEESNASEEPELYDADPDCQHDIQLQQSGIKCSKCAGWFCY